MATSTLGDQQKEAAVLPTTMSQAGWALVEARDDVEGVSFVPTVPKAELHRLLEDVAGVALGVQPFSDPELDAAPELEVVSRIGVGYDAVDVPALTRRKIPLMIGGTANSVSVAEAGVFLIMSLARRGAAMDRLVREGRWQDRYKEMPVDLYGKTVLIVGFRQDRHALGQALRGDGDACADLRPVYVFRDDPRHGLRAGAGPRRRGGARRFHHDPLPENARDDRPLQRRAAGAYEADRLHRQHRARRHHRREGALRRAEGEPHRRRRHSTSSTRSRRPQDNPLLTLPNFIARPACRRRHARGGRPHGRRRRREHPQRASTASRSATTSSTRKCWT